MTINEVKEQIVDVPNFPKEGILFKDITPLLLNPETFSAVTNHFAETIDGEIDKIVAIESRGFLLGAPLAHKLGIGMVLLRKPGKLARPAIQMSYGLEYGKDILELQEDDIQPGDRVLIVDDVLATGGTAEAAEKLCLQRKAEVKGCRFLIELDELKGREKLKAPVTSLMSF